MKSLTDLLHLLLCQHPHAYDMMEITDRKSERCYYYLECDISEGCSMPDHIKWQDITKNFKASLSLTSDEEALEFVKEAIRLAQSLRELSDGNEGRYHFIRSIMDL